MRPCAARTSARWADRLQCQMAAIPQKPCGQRHEEHDIQRIDCPIGLPQVAGKTPATIAVSVAADLLARLSRAAAPTNATEPTSHTDSHPRAEQPAAC
ncbi:XdhC family protein [Arthrobacter sp. JCM 19049]|uniref:XdhC family protein n=1 Tax=Arthrobacter sp. JCM 19049 TaxID=1460643 RepID=UPI00279536D9|nr:XdhC family protein [Arthrobacter sp. JCM 19049]